MNWGRVTPLAIPLAIVTVMSAVAAIGFRGVFADWSFLPAAVAGSVGAAAVVMFVRAARLGVPEALLVSIAAFVLVGTVATSGAPTPSAFETFFEGLIAGWSRLLSSTPPIDVTAEFRVLPFTVAWFGASVGGELLRVRRVPGLAALGPIAALVLTLLITLEDRRVALAQGAVMAVGTLLLAWTQQHQGERAERRPETTRSRPRRAAVGVASALAVAAVVTLAAPLLGPRLPLASANERFDLRQVQTPPFDPLEEPSLLAQVKAGLQDEYARRVVFRVTSDAMLDRFPLVVLDHYTNEFWAVADASSASARFRPVDSNFPPPDDVEIDQRESVEATIEIGAFDEIARGEFTPVWLPTPGWPVSITSDTPLDLRFAVDTGTVAAAPAGAPRGTVYDVVAALPPEFDDALLRGISVTPVEPLDLAVPQLRDFAADVLEGAGVGWEQVDAIRSRLVDTGFYDSRPTSVSGRPGHSLGRLAELVNDPDRVVGFEEQYAAVAGLLARGAGLPSRVVVGYRIDDPEARWTDGQLDVRADDVSAWIEVRFDGVGWVPVDVTPPRDRQPDDTPIGRSRREGAIPNPPPDPPPPALPPQLDRDEELDDEESSTQDDEEEEVAAGGGFWSPVTVVGTAVGIPLLVIVGLATLIVVLKRQRTERRRAASSPSRRVAGAWHEVLDRYQEAGASPASHATTHEFARGLRAASLVDNEEEALLLALADDADEAAYHPAPPTDERAAAAWEKSDALLVGLVGRQRGIERWRRRLDPRPLMRKDPLMSDPDEEPAGV
jgi:transglutaminase-like putative cysteine protease